MKSEIYHVFVLYEGNEVKYIGMTKTDVFKRLQDMVNQARNANSSNYNTAVSHWLRGMWNSFRQPSYNIVGSHSRREDAKAQQVALITEHRSTCLNILNNSLFMRPHGEPESDAAIEKVLEPVKVRRRKVVRP